MINIEATPVDEDGARALRIVDETIWGDGNSAGEAAVDSMDAASCSGEGDRPKGPVATLIDVEATPVDEDGARALRIVDETIWGDGNSAGAAAIDSMDAASCSWEGDEG